MLRDARCLITRRGAWPLYVVVFVTERCPARCAHCLLGEERYAGPELTVAEYEQTARAMRPFYFLLLTGGEPFMRPDVPEIVRAFARHCRVENVGIPTNGAFPKETERAARMMTSEFPRVQFGMDVSLDGIGPLHDALRGMSGLFDRAVETFNRLKKLAARASNLNVNAALTISRGNADSIMETADYLFNGLGVENVNLLLVRGEPRDSSSLQVDHDTYRAAAERLEAEMQRCGGGYRGYARAGFINAMRRVRTRVIERTVQTKRFQVPCAAARLGVVIRANGDVTACELRAAPLGNLRHAGFDFKSIWKGAAARRERRAILEEHCFCTYECFYTLNVLYNPRMAPKVLGEYLRMRRQRQRRPNGKNARNAERTTQTETKRV